MAENGRDKLTDFRCPRCGTPQARTNGVDIYFGPAKVPGHPTRLAWICINEECFYELKWRTTATNRKLLTEKAI